MSNAQVDSFPCRHTSIANPAGDGQEDLPALLRRSADLLEQLGDAEVLDFVIGNEINEHGKWWSATIYFA